MIDKTARATATASSNIALIKYWGNRDPELRIPSNGSISMTLKGLETTTSVFFDPSLTEDRFTLSGEPSTQEMQVRVFEHLDQVRALAGSELRAVVDSTNNFPSGAGIASSASGFAALTFAASNAAGLTLDSRQLSRLARLGSGSAARSLYAGYVEWFSSEDDEGSYAHPIAPSEHWALFDVIAIVSREHKEVSSTQGHALAESSPLQSARISDTPRRLEICRRAILDRDFTTLAQVVEQDTHLMHAVMQTSQPPVVYWTPASLKVMLTIKDLQSQGLEVCYSLDAGANVHCLCTQKAKEELQNSLADLPEVIEILISSPGPAPRLV